MCAFQAHSVMTYPQTVTPTQAGTWDLCSSAAVPASGHPSPPATNSKKLREATRDWVHETTRDWGHETTRDWGHETTRDWVHGTTRDWVHGTTRDWVHETTRDWVHETTHDWVHGHLKQILGKRYKQAKTQLPVVKSLEQKHAPCTRHLLRGGHNT